MGLSKRDKALKEEGHRVFTVGSHRGLNYLKQGKSVTLAHVADNPQQSKKCSLVAYRIKKAFGIKESFWKGKTNTSDDKYATAEAFISAFEGCAAGHIVDSEEGDSARVYKVPTSRIKGLATAIQDQIEPELER